MRSALVLLLMNGLQGQVLTQDPVPGQEVVVAAEDVEVAIESLYAYDYTDAEMQDFLATLPSLEAWARVNQETWRQAFAERPMLEALTTLPYWAEVERDPWPFTTTLCKTYLLFTYADPDEDAIGGAEDYIRRTEEKIASGKLTEEDRAGAQAQVDLAKAHLAEMRSIPEGNRKLYAASRMFLDPALQTWNKLGKLEEEPPIAFTHAGSGIRMRSGAEWSRDRTLATPTYRLHWLDAELTVVSEPWPEAMELDEAILGGMVGSLAEGNPTAEVLAQELGAGHDRVDARVTYRVADTAKHGVLYLVVAKGNMHMLHFLLPEANMDLMLPILEENLRHLEFDAFPMPMLVDRAIVGYQVFAEEPWAMELDAPEGVDLRLTYEGLEALIDITVAETDMTPEQFEAFGEYMHATSLEEYVEANEVGSGMAELHGFPMGYSEIFGPRKGAPEGQVLHVRQLYFNLGDRLLHLNIQAIEEDWAAFDPVSSQLIDDLQFVGGSTMVTFDRSHLGYVLEASSRWEESPEPPDGVELQLVHAEPRIVLDASRTALPTTEGLDESFLQVLHEAAVVGYGDPTDPTYMHGDFDGIPFAAETFEATLPGSGEDGIDLPIVSFTAYFRLPEDVLLITFMTSQEDWPTAAAEIETLLNALTFVPTEMR